MGRFCAAFGCNNHSLKKSVKTKNISFHQFPLHDPYLLKKWLLRLRRKDFVPSSYSCLCSEHFSEQDFEIQNFSKTRRLKSDAVPFKFCFHVSLRNEVQPKMKDHGKGFKAFLGQREKQCNKCGFATFSLYVLYKHRHKCQGKLLGPAITCSYCRRKFNFLSLYKSHQALCVKKLKKQKFLRNKLRVKHLGYKTKDTSFSCPICEAAFETKQQFVSHLKKQTCKSPEKIKKSSLSARKSINHQKSINPYRNVEEKHESSVSWPEKHPLSVHDDELYNCGWCKSYYPSKKLLQMHLEMNKECSVAVYKSQSYRKHSLTARKSISAVAKKSFPSKKRKTTSIDFYNPKRTSRSARKSLPSSQRNFQSSPSKLPLSECPVCYRCFPDTFSFFQHQKKMNHWGKATKSFNSTLKCPFCNKEFMHILSRDAHIQNHKNVPEYKLKAFFKGHTCNVCSNTFVSVFAKTQHIRIQHPDHSVSKHSGSGSNTQSVSDHVSKHKMSSVPKSVKKKLKQQPNTCPVCCKAFSHTVLRNKHFNEAHLKIFECQFCNTKFKSISSLNNHIKLSHSNDLECRQCKIKFKDELLLLQHVLKSHPNKDPKLFLPIKLKDLSPVEKEKGKPKEILKSNSERFNSHLLGNMEYYCDVCNIGYLKLCGLQRHRQSKLHKDTVEKKLDAVQKSLSDMPQSRVLSPQIVKQPEILICSECSEEFSSIKDFVPHRLSHFSVQSKYLKITEQNPYMCEICSEVLDSHSKVQLHLFWHLQIESTASSANESSGKKKTVMPDRLSGQHVAKKSFSKQSSESLQEVVIGGVAKPLFTCESCNVGFTTKEHYNIHVRKLCKKIKVQMTSMTNPGVQVENSINKPIPVENGVNGIVHCIKCNFMFCNSVKHDLHKPQCTKINFDACSEENVCNVDAVKSALIREICVAGCVTCGAIFESPVNFSHLSLHQGEANKHESDEVPEDVLHCALCNCLFPASAFKAHKEFCKVPIHTGDKAGNLKHMDVLKSALELKCAIAGCISCGEPYDDLDKFVQHLNLHLRGEIKSDSQNVRLCNGGETAQSSDNVGERDFSADKPLKVYSENPPNSSDDEQATAKPLNNSTVNIETGKQTILANINNEIEVLRENFSKLLCILIADADLMDTLGYGELLIDDVLVNVLTQMGQKTCADKKFTAVDKFRRNIQTLLDVCLKDQIMQDIGKDKVIDEIVVEALNIFEAE